MEDDPGLEDAKQFVRSVLVSRFHQKVDENTILATAKKVVSRSALGTHNRSRSGSKSDKRLHEHAE